MTLVDDAMLILARRVSNGGRVKLGVLIYSARQFVHPHTPHTTLPLSSL